MQLFYTLTSEGRRVYHQPGDVIERHPLPESPDLAKIGVAGQQLDTKIVAPSSGFPPYAMITLDNHEYTAVGLPEAGIYQERRGAVDNYGDVVTGPDRVLVAA